MGLRRRSLRLLSMAVVVALPLLATSGVATAKVAKGCHKTRTCTRGGGGTAGSGSGTSTPPPMTVQLDPNPQIETSSSTIAFVVQVETSPSLAGDEVDITSSQLDATCTEFTGVLLTGSSATYTFDSEQLFIPGTPLFVPLMLDDDGNASAAIFGQQCAPGTDVVEASLAEAPYYTALATLVANPPVVTSAGVFAFPTTSGTVSGGEVETGSSNVYAVLSIETDPVYAEQSAELSLTQLADRCLATNEWVAFPSGAVNVAQTIPGALLTTIPVTLDDDGNAVAVFAGSSCAAGSSVITADVEAGTHPTYITTFTVLPPQPTI